ncbi:hypothetical protein DSECCO2_520850 [anaerobic digester metagenome]
MILNVGLDIAGAGAGNRNVHHVNSVTHLAFPIYPGQDSVVKHGVCDHQDAPLFTQDWVLGAGVIQEHALIDSRKLRAFFAHICAGCIGEVATVGHYIDHKLRIDAGGLRIREVFKGLETHSDPSVIPHDKWFAEVSSAEGIGVVSVIKIRKAIGNACRIYIAGQISLGRSDRHGDIHILALYDVQYHSCSGRDDHAGCHNRNLWVSGLKCEASFLECRQIPCTAIDLYCFTLERSEAQFDTRRVFAAVNQAYLIRLFAQYDSLCPKAEST